MPSLWRLPRPAGPMDRRAVHRHLAAWLDVDHHASRKPWSWVCAGDGIEVGLLDDRLADRLAVRAGPGSVLVNEVSWPEVGAASCRRWTMDFVSPVTFRRGNKLLPWPSPSAVLGSLRADWRAFAAPHAGDVNLDLSKDPVVVSGVNGASEVEQFVLHERPDSSGKRVAVTVTVGGFRGQVSYELDGALDPHALGSLLAIAPYAGIGAHTTRGFGGVRVRS